MLASSRLAGAEVVILLTGFHCSAHSWPVVWSQKLFPACAMDRPETTDLTNIIINCMLYLRNGLQFFNSCKDFVASMDG